MADDVIELDFSDAPPAQGGMGSDHVPPGTYKLTISSAEKALSSTKKSMVTMWFRVASGEFAGRKVVERFVIPANADDSRFGLQRFHALLVALGLPEQKGRAKVSLAALVNKNVLADIDDEVQAATGRFPERVVSRILAFNRLSKAQQPAQQGPQTLSKIEPEEEDDEEEEIAETPQPKRKGKKAEEQPTETLDAIDIDSLFADLE